MQKKLFSILLAALVMCLLSFAVMAEDGVYVEIGDAEGLFALMNAEDEATLGANYMLTADIDMSAISEQTPIGSREVPFTGTFDGNGHKISGLNMMSFLTETGLFGGTKGATILNLTVAGEIVSTGNNVAGIVGRAVMPLTVKNCVNEASVLMMAADSKVGCGGIVGSIVTEGEGVALVIEDCVNYGAITSFSSGSGYCAGIAGYILSSKHADVNATITNCINYGPVDCMTASVGGGIMGYARFEGEGCSGTFTLTNSANFGSITARSYNGGIVGAIGGDNGVNNMIYTVNNVYNQGKVAGFSDTSSNSGSIIGLIRHPMTVDGVPPINVSNAMDTANDTLSMLGSLGALTDSSVTLSGLYTTAGESVIAYDPTVNGGIFVAETMVTVSSCAVATSDENTLAALVAMGGDAWAMVDGVPALPYFTDIIAGADAILESLAPETTAAPETTEAPDVTEAPDESKDAAETTAAPEDTEEDDEPKAPAATKAPATTAPSEDGGAPIGLIIGIVAAVIVVAAVVVIILKKKKN